MCIGATQNDWLFPPLPTFFCSFSILVVHCAESLKEDISGIQYSPAQGKWYYPFSLMCSSRNSQPASPILPGNSYKSLLQRQNLCWRLHCFSFLLHDVWALQMPWEPQRTGCGQLSPFSTLVSSSSLFADWIRHLSNSVIKYHAKTIIEEGLVCAYSSRGIGIHHHHNGEVWQQAGSCDPWSSQELRAHISNQRQEAEQVTLR